MNAIANGKNTLKDVPASDVTPIWMTFAVAPPRPSTSSLQMFRVGHTIFLCALVLSYANTVDAKSPREVFVLYPAELREQSHLDNPCVVYPHLGTVVSVIFPR